MKTNRLIRRIVTLFLCLALLLPISQNFFSLEVRAVTETVYSEDFEDVEVENAGWKKFYGGKISVTDEESASGNYSLKMTGRTKSWHSPGLNIYSLIKNCGAGTYTVTMKVMATSVDELNPRIGMLVRTNSENSFSKADKDGNYYARLAVKNDFEANKWTTIKGSFSVSESDIEVAKSSFNLMLDLLTADTGQVLYIDDVEIKANIPTADFTISNANIEMCISENKTVSLVPYSSVYNTIYTSENSNIAVVTSDGKITALSSGTVRITVTRKDITKYCNVTVLNREIPITNGTYYIRNAELKNYMQIDDNDAENGYASDKVIMELWNFSDQTYQQWNVTHIGNGYYKIISAKSGKALSVQEGKEDSDNMALVQETYNGYDRQKWTIKRLESGNIKIKPKSSETKSNDWCMAAGSGVITSNGRNVEQRKFVDNSNRIDEWTMLSTGIINAEHVVKVDVLYDRGYAERYNDPVTEIYSQLNKLRNLYWSEFGIWIEYNKPMYYTSTADLCPNTHYDDLCECASDEECVSSKGSAHHKNITNMLNNLETPDKEDCVRVLFSGHATCYIDKNNNHGGVSGLAIMSEYKCIVADQTDLQRQYKTMVHEIGHLFGAPDHYDDGITENLNENNLQYIFSNLCIYGKQHDDENVKKNITICDGCKAEILKNINIYNHK